MVERGRKRNVLPLEDRFGPRLAENAARFRINRTAFKVTVAMHDDQKLDGEVSATRRWRGNEPVRSLGRLFDRAMLRRIVLVRGA
jgi:hypothetical protein